MGRRDHSKIWREANLIFRQGQLLSHHGSWSFLPTGECDYWSSELYNILGFDPSKGVPGLSDYAEVVHADDRAMVQQTLDRMIAVGIGCDMTKRIVRSDGELRVMRYIGVPVFENDMVTRFIGTLTEITEQETATQELRLSQGVSRASGGAQLHRQLRLKFIEPRIGLLGPDFSNP
jgi:PAS domain S-box-containing protein